ncbi:MAG TPA: hypothetical protein VH234_04525 [Candidatus Saccharimonadales bacterium]|jgi:hypothetical protein|nr:hypothetical protein [Candidatus Saccharimonadales bacterium]
MKRKPREPKRGLRLVVNNLKPDTGSSVSHKLPYASLEELSPSNLKRYGVTEEDFRSAPKPVLMLEDDMWQYLHSQLSAGEIMPAEKGRIVSLWALRRLLEPPDPKSLTAPYYLPPFGIREVIASVVEYKQRQIAGESRPPEGVA